MITRRDIAVAAVAIGATLGAVAFAGQGGTLTNSTVFDWNTVPAEKNATGEVRSFLRSGTATLDELEVHATTLIPGDASHPPHKHPNEELIIVKQGTLSALANGEWKKADAGSVIFFGSDQLHGVRNSGSSPATYYVIAWKTHAAP